MVIKLNRIDIKNFKGIKSLTVTLHGRDAEIRGANATGKTSVYDAFLWLLFDKDSSGSSAFSAKPTNHDGEIHGLTTEVSAEITIDGAVHTLARVLSENWVKPRGRAEAVFQGNVSAYEIDGIPRKASEFAAFCAGLIDEATFRLVTNPAAFNAQKWQERRAALLRLTDCPTELTDAKYDPIISDVRAHGADDTRKLYQAQRRKLNSELDQIPARVDEVTAMVPTYTDRQYSDAQYIVNDTGNDIARVRALIANSNASKVAAEMAVIDNQIDAINRRNLVAKARAESDNRKNAEAARRYADMVELCKTHLADANAQRAKLREEWRDVNAEAYVEPDNLGICPTCGQELPPDKAQEARECAKSAWETDKRKRLDAITESGKSAKARADAAQTDIDRYGAVQATPDIVPELEPVPDDIIARKAELTSVKLDGALEKRLADLIALNDKHANILRAKSTRDQGERRIAELTERQKELGRLVADIDNRMMLLDEYTAELSNKVEASVGKLFTAVSWRLYDRQINGGLVPTCKCLIGGVPYDDANNAARINGGLEIINVISERMGISVPIFIDNAEAVNSVMPTCGQQIRLIVTTDAELVIKTAA